MRVSTAMIFQSGTQAMLDRQEALLRTQQQLSTGRRILVPSDDPVGSAQAVGIGVARDVTAQYTANVAAARSSLSLAESSLGDVGGLLQSVRERMVQSGDASLSDADRRALAQDLQSSYDELLSVANRRDGQSRYLFAGFREDAAAFVDTGTGVSYQGDQGVRSLEVAAGRTMAVGASGASVFQGMPTGNGTFATAASAANTGSGSIGVGSVANAAALTGHAYDIAFSVVGATTTYTVTDTTLGAVVSAGNPYTSGASFVVDGQQLAVTGNPANGDRFTVAPSARTDLFKPIADAIAALKAPQSSAAARGQLATARERALAELDQGTEQVLSMRAQFGASLRELDTLDDVHSGVALQLETDLSRITSLDYAAAISQFTQEQQALEAAQKAFQGTTKLSLFSLL